VVSGAINVHPVPTGVSSYRQFAILLTINIVTILILEIYRDKIVNRIKLKLRQVNTVLVQQYVNV